MEWSALSSLAALDLRRNNISGQLPVAWASGLRLLSSLWLGGNSLSGSLPPSWARLRSLLQLDVSGNALTGALPPEWGDLAQLTSLDASRNTLAGQLPPEWSGLGALQALSLRSNALTGTIPSAWNALGRRVYRIDLGGNVALCGDVPDALARATGRPQRNGTALGRPCPWEPEAMALLSLKAAVGSDPSGVLNSWQPECNPCGLPGWAGISCAGGRVVGVSLTGANLTGLSLAPLAQLTALESVQLSGNTVAHGGPLPASWAGLPALRSLACAYCGLAGPLPAAWGALRALEEISLQGNALTGPVPGAWSGMSGLKFL